MKTWVRTGWWADDPAVQVCEIGGCGCPIQRTPSGTVADGMRLHVATVHQNRRPTSLTARTAGAS